MQNPTQYAPCPNCGQSNAKPVGYTYGQAGQQIYDFLWSDFADWYVEIAKEQMKNEELRTQTVETLARVLDITLRLLHPFTPFITEEVWGYLHSAVRESPISDLAKDWPDALIVAKWPEPRDPEGWEAEKVADFELIQEIVRAICNLRAEKNVAPSKKIASSFSAGAKADLLNEQSKVIAFLAGLDHSQFTQKAPPALVQKERDKLAAYKDTAEKIKAQLK